MPEVTARPRRVPLGEWSERHGGSTSAGLDHRLGRRKALTIAARLGFQDGSRGWGVTENIGSGGLFVRTAATPRRNGCVEVRLILPLVQGHCFVCLPGLVVHRGGNGGSGLGIMFRDLDPRAERVIADFLAAAPGGPG